MPHSYSKYVYLSIALSVKKWKKNLMLRRLTSVIIDATLYARTTKSISWKRFLEMASGKMPDLKGIRKNGYFDLCIYLSVWK